MIVHLDLVLGGVVHELPLKTGVVVVSSLVPLAGSSRGRAEGGRLTANVAALLHSPGVSNSLAALIRQEYVPCCRVPGAGYSVLSTVASCAGELKSLSLSIWIL